MVLLAALPRLGRVRADVQAPDAVSGAGVQRRAWGYVAGSVLLVLAMVGTSFWATDDAFPLAPYRMFSYGNKQDGVVRSLRLEGTLETGAHVRIDPARIGLRRAELEGQTPFNSRMPDHKVAALAEAYNDRHDEDVVHLQVVQRSTRLRGGEPQPGEDLVVLADWADERWDGPRAEVDLPVADVLPGYRR